MRYIKSLSHIIFLSIALFAGNMVHYVTAQQKPGSFDMQDLEKELLEANRAIEEYVANLSPQEQEEFNRAVDEVSQMFDNMSEEEFSKFLGEMFEEEPTAAAAPISAPAPEQKVEEVVLSSEQKKKLETVLTVLNDIIRQSNVFTVQMHSSSETINAIDRWGKKGVIPNWQAGGNWKVLEADITKLVQKIHKVQDQNADTKEYKYIFDLIADESLLNNLIQLQTNLNKSVPRIEVPEFGIEKLNSKTKKTIKEAIGYYAESLYLLNIPKSLDTVFEKHEPKAEKSRQAEEAAEKRAAEAAKRTRVPVGATEAGVFAEGYGDYGYGGGYGGGYGDYGSYGGGYGDYGSYGGGYGDYGSYGDYGDEGGESGGRAGRGGAGGGGSSGGAGAAAGAGTEKTEEEKKAEEEAKKKLAAQQAAYKKDEDVEEEP